MPVRLTGELVCDDAAQAATVREHLPRHVALTLREPGCTAFDVAPTEDPLVWRVDECFVDEAAFRAHQERVAASTWGTATAGITRRYRVDRDDGP
ncbi:putative quinol monooxygenase [Cellulosimicrobium marinum]|uniref:putative quinol monooxygenase n=1 Tax=Cellulosimicrobium marinum TaxID=1638992 RepID=UPI001E62F986|nr:antibiotic biosynthesis monooxygenase [Cellulosimicrobium marinum]MCB7136986.1 antibiotic biosynthesis monooxygenase [Cellulosimicrobium marinum]